MSLMRRDPFNEFLPLREVMNHLVEESFLRPGRLEGYTGYAFPLDVYESDDQRQYVIEASLAGVKPEEIRVTAEGQTLTITAARKEEQQTKKGGYLRHELVEGEMRRAVAFPADIDVDKIQATYERGVLTLRVPRAASAKQKQIPIQIKEVTGPH